MNKISRAAITFIAIIAMINLVFAVEYPGLRETDGSIHPIHIPHVTTGDTLNILDFGADPLDSENDDQAAFDLAYAQASAGDEIYFPPGYYNFNRGSIYKTTAHYRIKSEVNIRGASRDSVFFISNFPDDVNATQSTMFFYGPNVHDLVIEGITFTSTYDGVMPTSLVDNNTDTRAPLYGIFFCDDGAWRPSYNVTVRDCKFELIRRIMIRLESSHDMVVKNTIFTKATDLGGGGAGYGVSIQGDGHEIFLTGYPADNMHNLVDSCSFIGPYIRHGVVIQYTAHNNVVRNSYFYKNGYDAIDLHGEDEYLNEAYGNTAEDMPTGAGIAMGNTGAEHDASGRKNYIHDNTINNCREGVKVMLRSPQTRIEGNVTDNCTRGLYILNGPGTELYNNEVRNGLYGIHLAHDYGTLGNYDGDPDSVIIEGNNIYNNSYGLLISAGTNIMLGENTYSGNIVYDTSFAAGVTFIPYTDVKDVTKLPEGFELMDAYPNPFNPSTKISYRLSTQSLVKLNMYDIRGDLLETLYDNWADAGTYSLTWNAKGMPSGVYILSLRVGSSIKTQKLLLMK